MAEWSLMEAPVVEGYLTKRGDIVKNWKKRWFCFQEDRLVYYKRKGDTKSLGYIPLGFGCSVVKFDKDDKEAPESIEQNETSPRSSSPSSSSVKNVCAFRIITKKRTFLLEAESKEEMRSWVKRLKGVLEYVFERNTQTPFAAMSSTNAVHAPGGSPLSSPTKPPTSRSADSSPTGDSSAGDVRFSPPLQNSAARAVNAEEKAEECLGVHNNSTSQLICDLECDLSKDKRHTVSVTGGTQGILDGMAIKERLNAAATKVDNFQRTTNARIQALEFELDEARSRQEAAEARAQKLEAMLAKDKAASGHASEMEVLRSRNRVHDEELDALRQQLAMRDEKIEEMQKEAEEKNFLLLQQAKNQTSRAVPVSTVARPAMDRATSREQLLERVADLERRLGKAKAGMMAQQTHTSFLNSEVERLEKEKSLLESTRNASSQDWKSEVAEYRKAYLHIKRKYNILCTKYGEVQVDMPELASEQRQAASEAEKVKFLTERYFMSYVAACKLRKVVKGQLCDLNSRQLFEQAVAEKVPVSKYEAWIKDRVQANVAALASR